MGGPAVLDALFATSSGTSFGASFAAVLAALLAGLAVAGLVDGPTRRLRRLDRREAATGPPRPPWVVGRGPGWRGVLRGRVDAAPWPRRLLLAASFAAAVLVLPAIVSGPVPGVWGIAPGVALLPLATVGLAVGLGLLEPAAARRRSDRLMRDTPLVLELLAACFAAGLPPRVATAAVLAAAEGPVAADLRTVVSAVEVGMSDARAWGLLRDHPTLGEAAADLVRSLESGTRLVETLVEHAQRSRDRRRAALEVAAKALGVRCVLPMMVCFIPAFLLLGVVPTVVSSFLAALPAGLWDR